MKASFKNLVITLFGIATATAYEIPAQTFNTTFKKIYVPKFGSVDHAPGGLVVSGNILVGTLPYGGAFNTGSVFSVKIDGSGFKTLHSFSGYDGAVPKSGLLLSGNTLYGTTTHNRRREPERRHIIQNGHGRFELRNSSQF